MGNEGVFGSARRSADAETHGDAAERANGRPGREWIIAHGGQSRDFRCDGTGAGATAEARRSPSARGNDRVGRSETAFVIRIGSASRLEALATRSSVDAGADPTPAFLGEGALLLPLAKAEI